MHGKTKPAPSALPLPVPNGHRTPAQIAQLTFELTLRFCDRYVDSRSTLYDALMQAARRSSPDFVPEVAPAGKRNREEATADLKRRAAVRSGFVDLQSHYNTFLQQTGATVWQQTDPRREHLLAQNYTTASAVLAWIQRQHQAVLLRAVAHQRNEHGGRPHDLAELGAAEGAGYPELMANTALALLDHGLHLLDAEAKR